MLDTSTKLQLLAERFKSKSESMYVESMKEALGNVIAKLAKTEGQSEIKRLNSIKRFIEEEIGTLYESIKPTLAEDMQGFAKVQHEVMFNGLNSETGAGYAFGALPKDTIKEIINMDSIILMNDKGYTLNEMFSTASNAQIDRYKQIISAGLAENAGYGAITKRLKDANAVGTTTLQAIVHTAVSSARDKANVNVYKKFDKYIDYFESTAVLDSRTSFICSSLDGKIYRMPYDKIPNKPPRHFNCRSVLTPRSDSFKTNTTRQQNGDSKGQISSNVKFPEWFGKQSPQFQLDYLGKARYDLYKSGKMEFKQFVDVKSGKLFSLDEISWIMKPVATNKFNVKDLVGFTDEELANMVNERRDRLPILKSNPVTKAIMSWSEDEYIEVRKHYQGIKNSANTDTLSGLKQLFNMDGNFNGTMYRGLSIEDMQVSKIIDNLSELDDFTDIAPSSWTKVEEVAHDFANINNLDTKSFILKMESKTNLAYDVHSMSTFMDEGELILAPNAKIRVKNISYSIIEDEKIKVITLEEY